MDRLFEFVTLILTILQIYIVALIRAITPFDFLPKKSLRGRKILITGSGSGLGRLLSIELGKLGAEIVLWDVNEQGNQETLRTLENLNISAIAYTVNLCDSQEIKKHAELTKEEVGKIDILINNAGVATGKLILNSTEDAIERSFAVNIKAHFYTVQNFLPPMLEANNGHIVTIASAAGKMASAGLADYTATKHAAVGFHDSLVAEIAETGKTNVKTTLVCPYYFHTPMFDATGARTRFPSLFPILQPEHIVQKIVEAIQTNQEYLVTPKSFYYVLATVNMLPYRVQEVIGQYLGLIQSLDRFNRK